MGSDTELSDRNDGPPAVILVGPENKEHAAAVQVGLAPRFDYRLVAERFAGGRVWEMHATSSQLHGHKAGRLLRSQIANLRGAAWLLRSLPDDAAIYATGEAWGLPISLAATALRHHRQTIIWQVHQVWSASWRLLLRGLRPFLHVDGWICQSDHQTDVLRQMLADHTTPVISIPQGVDTRFFRPLPSPARSQPGGCERYILAVGAANRNYALLFQAAARLDLPVVVKASSAWMAGKWPQDLALPPNICLHSNRISYVDLRTLYEGAAVVAMPLYDTDSSAGVTSIFEAMAMGKVVVATRSHGLPDVLVDGVTGRIVASAPEALAAALVNEDGRKAMAARAFAAAGTQCTVEMHAARVADFIAQVVAGRQSGA